MTQTEETRKKQEEATSGNSNVTTNVMMKVPTERLQNLRRHFDEFPNGLTLVQFLNAFIENMDLPDDHALIDVLPNIIDLFTLVDVNGDNLMEWSELVMFIIEQVVQDQKFTIHEKFVPVNHHSIQYAASRCTVKKSLIMQNLNRMVVGIGSEIQVYSQDSNSSSWLSEADVFTVSRKNTRSHVGSNQTIEVADMAFMESLEVFFILRSDLCIELREMTAKSSINDETVVHRGFFPLDHFYTTLQVSDFPECPRRLYLAGNRKEVDCWNLKVNEKTGEIELINHAVLTGMHKDVVKDILIIDSEDFRYLASASLDKTVLLWDPYSLEYRETKNGHSAGVMCLAFDGISTLLAGGFDYSILAWDLESHVNNPLYSLRGHEYPVTRVLAFGKEQRCFSLDSSGYLRMWDMSRSNPHDGEDRMISSFYYGEDHIRALCGFNDISGRFNSAHRLMVIAQGRRQHVLKITDITADTVSAPVSVLYSAVLMTIVTVHTKCIIYWSAIDGHVLHTVSVFERSNTNIAMTAAVLDCRQRRVITGDSAGTITLYNCLTGAKLRDFPPLPYSIHHMIYTPDKTIVAVVGSSIWVIDDDPEVRDEDTGMRDVKAHECEISSVAFSYKLGLIASIDVSGLLVVWNYEFLGVEAIIPNIVKSECSQVHFLDPLPLLCVTGNGHLKIVPVGVAGRVLKRKIWHLDVTIEGDDLSVMSDLTNEQIDAESRALSAVPSRLESILETEALGEGSHERATMSPLASPSRETVTLQSQLLSYDSEGNLKPPQQQPRIRQSKSRRLREAETAQEMSAEEKGAVELQQTEEAISRSSQRPSVSMPSFARKSIMLANQTAARMSESLAALKEEADAEKKSEDGDHESNERSSDSENEDDDDDDDDDDEEDEGGYDPEGPDDATITSVQQPKIFGTRKLKDFVHSRKEVRSITHHVVSKIFRYRDREEGDLVKVSMRDIANQPRAGNFEALDAFALEHEYKSFRPSFQRPSIHSIQSPKTLVDDSQKVVDYFPPLTKDLKMHVFCGHDDGAIAKVDLTQALRAINVGVPHSRYDAWRKQGYNPRRVIHKYVRSMEQANYTWSPQEVRGYNKIAIAHVNRAWTAHSSPISRIHLMGDFDDLLSFSDDMSVQLWSLKGTQRGVLTRGREMDALFRTRWRSVMNMAERTQSRHDDAIVIRKALGLKRRVDPKTLAAKLALNKSAREPEPPGSGIMTPLEPSLPSFSLSKKSLPTLSTDSKEHAKPRHGGSVSSSNASGSVAPFSVAAGSGYTKASLGRRDPSQIVANIGDEPDRDRCVGQLRNRITYQLSNKDYARLALADKHEAILQGIRDIGHEKSKPKKKKTRHGFEKKKYRNPFDDPKYLKDVMDSGSKYGGGNRNSSKDSRSEATHLRVVARYEQELLKIDAKDPNNWEMTSNNRQRALYKNLFLEMDSVMNSRNRMVELNEMLDSLTPGGDFKKFAETLKKSRSEARKALRSHANSGESAAMQTSQSQALQALTCDDDDLADFEVKAKAEEHPTVTIHGAPGETSDAAADNADAVRPGSCESNESPIMWEAKVDTENSPVRVELISKVGKQFSQKMSSEEADAVVQIEDIVGKDVDRVRQKADKRVEMQAGEPVAPGSNLSPQKRRRKSKKLVYKVTPSKSHYSDPIVHPEPPSEVQVGESVDASYLMREHTFNSNLKAMTPIREPGTSSQGVRLPPSTETSAPLIAERESHIPSATTLHTANHNLMKTKERSAALWNSMSSLDKPKTNELMKPKAFYSHEIEKEENEKFISNALDKYTQSVKTIKSDYKKARKLFRKQKRNEKKTPKALPKKEGSVLDYVPKTSGAFVQDWEKAELLPKRLTASLRISKQTSIEHVVEIAKLSQATEMKWVKNIKEGMIEDFRSEKGVPIIVNKNAKHPVFVHNETSERPRDRPSASRGSRLFILSKSNFGPYAAGELTDFLEAFETAHEYDANSSLTPNHHPLASYDPRKSLKNRLGIQKIDGDKTIEKQEDNVPGYLSARVKPMNVIPLPHESQPLSAMRSLPVTPSTTTANTNALLQNLHSSIQMHSSGEKVPSQAEFSSSQVGETYASTANATAARKVSTFSGRYRSPVVAGVMREPSKHALQVSSQHNSTRRIASPASLSAAASKGGEQIPDAAQPHFMAPRKASHSRSRSSSIFNREHSSGFVSVDFAPTKALRRGSVSLREFTESVNSIEVALGQVKELKAKVEKEEDWEDLDIILNSSAFKTARREEQDMPDDSAPAADLTAEEASTVSENEKRLSDRTDPISRAEFSAEVEKTTDVSKTAPLDNSPAWQSASDSKLLELSTEMHIADKMPKVVSLPANVGGGTVKFFQEIPKMESDLCEEDEDDESVDDFDGEAAEASDAPAVPNLLKETSFKSFKSFKSHNKNNMLDILGLDDYHASVETLAKQSYFVARPHQRRVLEKMTARDVIDKSNQTHSPSAASTASSASENVLVNLTEVVRELFPHMSALERDECLTFMSLKTRQRQQYDLLQSERHQVLQSDFSYEEMFRVIWKHLDIRKEGRVARADADNLFATVLRNKITALLRDSRSSHRDTSSLLRKLEVSLAELEHDSGGDRRHEAISFVQLVRDYEKFFDYCR